MKKALFVSLIAFIVSLLLAFFGFWREYTSIMAIAAGGSFLLFLVLATRGFSES